VQLFDQASNGWSHWEKVGKASANLGPKGTGGQQHDREGGMKTERHGPEDPSS